MKKEVRTVIYDDELRLEAYRFEGIMQPFPNHFHEYYVIGSVENGKRCLSCKNKEYTLQKGNIVLFNPGDNHACVQGDDGTLDYRALNISRESMLNLTEEVTCYLRSLHEMISCFFLIFVWNWGGLQIRRICSTLFSWVWVLQRYALFPGISQSRSWVL